MTDNDTATFGGADDDFGGFDDFDDGAASGRIFVLTAALPCPPIHALCSKGLGGHMCVCRQHCNSGNIAYHLASNEVSV